MRINKHPATITRADIDQALEGSKRRQHIEVSWLNVKPADAQGVHGIIRDALKAHGMDPRFTSLHRFDGGRDRELTITICESKGE